MDLLVLAWDPYPCRIVLHRVDDLSPYALNITASVRRLDVQLEFGDAAGIEVRLLLVGYVVCLVDVRRVISGRLVCVPAHVLHS